MINGCFDIGLEETPWLLLLPCAFVLIYTTLPHFRSDATVLTPRNVMLFLLFNKLVIVPLELWVWGNKALIFNPANHLLFDEIFIVLAAFLAFVLGWTMAIKPTKSALATSIVSLRWLVLGYCSVGIFSVLWLYGSLQNYAVGSLFTYINREVVERVSGQWLGYLTNVGQRFLPFGVMLAWHSWQKEKPFGLRSNVFWLLGCLLCTLSSNRANILYPLLTFLSLMLAYWRVKNKIWLVVGGIASLFLLFFFGYLRVQPTLDRQQVGSLFELYLSQTDYLLYAHQVYFGTPYQITPLLQLDTPLPATWWASLLDPVPVLGQSFREQSGGAVYNLLIYNSVLSQDKVVPVAGELFYNGGYTAVILCHVAFGWVYAKLNGRFESYLHTAPLVAMGYFYLALLFSATLLLSLSVLVQFLVYNAAPALLLLWLHRKK